jgi:hypothetical protein
LPYCGAETRADHAEIRVRRIACRELAPGGRRRGGQNAGNHHTRKRGGKSLEVCAAMNASKGVITAAPKLTPQPLVGGDGWFVRVEWPDFREDVGAFASRSEAETWIEQKSAEWVERYRRPLAPSRIK